MVLEYVHPRLYELMTCVHLILTHSFQPRGGRNGLGLRFSFVFHEKASLSSAFPLRSNRTILEGPFATRTGPPPSAEASFVASPFMCGCLKT
eukprot:6985881-Pyramimonas_sp.AAC.1